jgi:HipA-like protein
MAVRLVEECGSPQAAADAVWALARENVWYREGEGAERFLLAQPGTAKAPVNKAALDLLVAWHGEPLDRLTGDGNHKSAPGRCWCGRPRRESFQPSSRRSCLKAGSRRFCLNATNARRFGAVERFDIRRDPQDQRRSALEDSCSILDLPASAKYDGTSERMARGLRPLSTDPAADLDILFRRAVFAWQIADGDMHLKNFAILKIADAGAKAFTAVRFAPLYDAVTTRVFPGLGGDRMALKLNGRDDRLNA